MSSLLSIARTVNILAYGLPRAQLGRITLIFVVPRVARGPAFGRIEAGLSQIGVGFPSDFMPR